MIKDIDGGVWLPW
ncbi:hypothetical protein A2U01_0100278, partial [Trifolium medium]|nr:hypothetical protein [Trifolium medium]